MNILNTPLNEISFENIDSFCREGNIENIQLDYKMTIPNDGLAKHFASFSNTRGGLIILGVQENCDTGRPVKWEGVELKEKLEDRIHQFATNVEPTPNYEIRTTNEVRERAFILIRIYEGYETPYYVQNDPNLYVRTGNITKLVGLASPEQAEILYLKKEKALKNRELAVQRVAEIYKYTLVNAEKERLNEIIEEKDRFQRSENLRKQTEGDSFVSRKYESSYTQEVVGTQATMFSITLMPYFPLKPLISLDNLETILSESRIHDNGWDLPDLNMNRMPDGMYHFIWGKRDGFVTTEQIYANGTIHYAVDVLHPSNDNIPYIWISNMSSTLMRVLLFSNNFYSKIGYHGSIVGNIELKRTNNCLVRPISPSNSMFFPDFKPALKDSYEWKIEDLNTAILNDRPSLQNYHINRIKEFYWSFDYKPIDEIKFYELHYKDNRWEYIKI